MNADTAAPPPGTAPAAPAGALHRWHRRLRRVFLAACALSAVVLVGWLLILVPHLAGQHALFDALFDAKGVLGDVVALVFLGVPALVPLLSLAYMVLSLLIDHPFERREIGWASFALAISALGLFLFTWNTECVAKGAKGLDACGINTLRFVLDQALMASFGDVFEVFNLNLSTLEPGGLNGFNQLLVMSFRLLTAVCVVALVVMLSDAWRARRPGTRGWTPALQAGHARVRGAFIGAGWVSAVCITVWFVAIATDANVGHHIGQPIGGEHPLWLQTLDAGLVSSAVLVPTVVPLVSLVYMVLSMAVGHRLQGREFALSTFALMVCGLGLLEVLSSSQCPSPATDGASAALAASATRAADASAPSSALATPAASAAPAAPGAAAACNDQLPGFVLDQFSKGAFADVFDIYDLKLSPMKMSSLSRWEQVLVLNFRLMSAVYLVALVVTLNGRRRRR